MKKNRPLTEDLTDVIEKKPYKLIGYLPLETLEKLCHVSRNKVISVCQEYGINVKVFEQKECHIGSGAIVCWRDEEVQRVLNEHKALLKKDQIPSKSKEYIDYIMNNWIHKEEKINSHNLCGFLFGDSRYIPLSLE